MTEALAIILVTTATPEAVAGQTRLALTGLTVLAETAALENYFLTLRLTESLGISAGVVADHGNAPMELPALAESGEAATLAKEIAPDQTGRQAPGEAAAGGLVRILETRHTPQQAAVDSSEFITRPFPNTTT